MAERIVINTGPIFAIASADAGEIVASLPYEFLSPLQVRREIEQGPAAGHALADASWIRFVALTSPLSPLAISNLDEGEAAVIQLALEEGIARVCIDERKGRRAALSVDLEVTGTLGLLGRAKVLGKLSAVKPIVDRMISGGTWFDPALLDRFYHSIGE